MDTCLDTIEEGIAVSKTIKKKPTTFLYIVSRTRTREGVVNVNIVNFIVRQIDTEYYRHRERGDRKYRQ